MDLCLFDNSAIVLVGKQAGLFDVSHPGSVGAPSGPQSSVQNQSTSSSGEAPQYEAKVETPTLLSPEEEAALADQNLRMSNANVDPNKAAIQSNLQESKLIHKEQITWLEHVLGADVAKALRSANKDSLRNISDVARIVYEVTGGDLKAVQALLNKLHAIKSSLPREARADLDAITGLIGEIETRAAADGLKISSSASTHDQYKARSAELEQVITKLQDKLATLLPKELAAQLKSQGFLGVGVAKKVSDAITKKFDAQLKELRAELKAAKDAGNKERVQLIKSKISDVQANQKQALQQARILGKVLQAGDRALSSENLEQINQFFNLIDAPRGGAQEGIQAAVLNLDEVRDLDQLEGIVNVVLNAEETAQAGTQSTAHSGDAGAPQESSSGAGIQSAGGTGNDEPVDEAEMAKKVLMEEGQDIEGQGSGAGIQSEGATAEEHAEIQGDWMGLTQAEMGMKIASSSVVMGITSSYYRGRSDERKLKGMIDKLIAAISRGDLDAISTALILIGRRSQESLRKVSLTMIKAMKYYEEQQSGLNDELESLTRDMGPTFGADMQAINNKMNMYSSNRQALMSMFRDTKAQVDTIENLTKSILDIEGRQKRQLAQFQA